MTVRFEEGQPGRAQRPRVHERRGADARSEPDRRTPRPRDVRSDREPDHRGQEPRHLRGPRAWRCCSSPTSGLITGIHNEDTIEQYRDERAPAGTAALSGPLVRSAGDDAARDRAALGRAGDHRRGDVELRRGNDYSILDTTSPNLTYKPERLTMEKGEGGVLAAGPHRAADDAQPRHHRHARQADHLCKDRARSSRRSDRPCPALRMAPAESDAKTVKPWRTRSTHSASRSAARRRLDRPALPPREPMVGSTCRWSRSTGRSTPLICMRRTVATGAANWTYLPYGPFATFDEYGAWSRRRGGGDPHVPCDRSISASGEAGRRRELSPDRSRRGLDRGRPHPLLAAVAADRSPPPRRCT